VATLVIALVVIACSSADDDTPVPAAATAPPSVATTAPVVATARPAPTAPPAAATVQIKRGGILRSLSPGPPAALDPGKGNYWVACQLNQTYGKLMEFRAQDYTDPVMVPRLAESWEVRDGGQTIQLNLREDATWQNIAPVNGRGFTADDVAFNIDWYKENSTQSWLWDPVSSYEVVDEHTIVLTLDKPSARFLNDMGSPWNEMLPKEVWERDGNFRTAQIGTGAFLYDTFEPESKLTRIARPDHWKMGKDGSPLPYIDGWNTTVIADSTARLAALLGDQVDLWRCLGGPNFEDLDQVRKSLPGVDLKAVPRINFTHVRIQPNKPPWDDERIRRAAMLAIDPQLVIDAAWEGDGQWSGFIPPSQPGYTWSAAKVKEMFKQNIEEAKSLIALAGFDAESLKIETMPFPSGQGGLILHEVVQQMLNDVGFDVKIKQVASRSEYSGLVNAGNFDVLISTDTPDGDPDGYVGRLYSKGSSYAEQYGITMPDGFEAIVDRVRGEVDPAKRKAAVDEAQEMLYDYMPRIPILTYNVHKVLPAHVKMPNALYWAYGLPGLDEVWLDR